MSHSQRSPDPAPSVRPSAQCGCLPGAGLDTICGVAYHPPGTLAFRPNVTASDDTPPRRAEAASQAPSVKTGGESESKPPVTDSGGVEEPDASSSVAELQAEAEALRGAAQRRQQAAVELRAEAALLREETTKLLPDPNEPRAEVARLGEAVQAARKLVDAGFEGERGAEVQSEADGSRDPSPPGGPRPHRRRWFSGRRDS